jgi:hypothetical protein
MEFEKMLELDISQLKTQIKRQVSYPKVKIDKVSLEDVYNNNKMAEIKVNIKSASGLQGSMVEDVESILKLIRKQGFCPYWVLSNKGYIVIHANKYYKLN